LEFLSRFSETESLEDIDYLAVISGPEPLRTSLEKCLITAFQVLSDKKTVIVRGVYNTPTLNDLPNISFYNHLKSKELNALICRSKLVVCRSGYSSVMDLACLGKKAFLYQLLIKESKSIWLSVLKNKALLLFQVRKILRFQTSIK